MPLRPLPLTGLFLLSAALPCLGCDGGADWPAGPSGIARDQSGAAAAPSGVAGGPSFPGTTAPGGAACSNGASGLLPPRLLVLSEYQHLNSLRTLLGAEAISPEDAAEYTVQTKPFSQKGVVVNSSVVHQRLAWAEGAGKALGPRFQAFTGCAPGAVDDGCARRFLSDFAARAFRRPVEAAEVEDLMGVYTTAKASGFAQGVQRAVEAVLAAPSFLYRREIGVADARGGLALSPHELASELAFLLTDAPPDADLRAAADTGTLAKDDEVKRQVGRLLSQSAVQDSLGSTLISAWGVSNVFGSAKDPTLFPEYSPQLQAAMYHETELFVRDVLWTRKAPVGELLSSNRTFVNEPLAKIYGVPFTGSPGEYAPVTLPPERAGLLTQPSLLAAYSRTDTTSVVARGLFVRGPVLCLSKLPAPPASLAGRVQDLLKADMTERQRAEVRAGDAACAGCHSGIDPFGLLMEGFDPLGRTRTMLKGLPIDDNGMVSAGTLHGNFDGAAQFAMAAAHSAEFSACVSRHLLAYATQNDELLASDCDVTSISASNASSSMSALVEAVATSHALRLRAKETP
jgi:hypothetical protein